MSLTCKWYLFLETVTCDNILCNLCVVYVNVSCRYFSEAALDIFNCQEVFLDNLDVTHNTGTRIVRDSYRGNTGGVAIGINSASANFSVSPVIEISNSIFTNNSALATSRFHTASQTSFDQVFTGRGGALGVWVNESFYNVSLVTVNCTFKDNLAKSFGGAIYVLINGLTAQHEVRFERTHIFSNTVELHGGGGMQLTFLSKGIPAFPHMANFTKCKFEDNAAEIGGGIYVETSIQGNRCNQ